MAVAAVLTVIVWAGGCASTPGPAPAAGQAAPGAEQQVAAVLTRLHDDLEHRRLQRVLSAVSDRYQDDAGNNFDGARDYLARQFRAHRSVRITRTPPKITVKGDEARSVETLGIAGEPAGGNTRPFTFQGNVAVTLRRVADTWQVIKVQVLR